MGGVSLSRLWASHPKWAFVLHLIVTLMMGGFAISFVYSGVGWVSVLVIVIGFVLMAGSLVFLTWFATKEHWQPDDYSDATAPTQLPSLRAAWESAQARERVLWMVFSVVFLVGLVLGMAKNVVGLEFILLAIALAVVATRAGK